MKVSFDFDSTLDRKDVQEFAKELIGQGIEVWVCTSRFEEENLHPLQSNFDLFQVTDKLKIPKEHVIFTNMKDKYTFLEEKGFLFHLDDDHVELMLMDENKTFTQPVYVERSDWKDKCIKIIESEKE